MRRYNTTLTSNIYKKYGYPKVELLFSDCNYNNACAAIESCFSPKKINAEALDRQKGIMLLKTEKGDFIIDEFYQDKTFSPRESGLVSLITQSL